MGLPIGFQNMAAETGMGEPHDQLKAEALKGCDPTPIGLCNLEPYYQPYGCREKTITIDTNVPDYNLEFLRFSFKQPDNYKWRECRSIIDSLGVLHLPVFMTLMGNCDNISFEIGVPTQIASITANIFSKFPWLCIDRNTDNRLQAAAELLLQFNNRLYLREFRPAPPSHHQHIYIDKDEDSPLTLIYESIRQTPKGSLAIFQSGFQGARSDWVRNFQEQQIVENRIAGYGTRLDWFYSDGWKPERLVAAFVRVAVIGPLSCGATLDSLSVPIIRLMFPHSPPQYAEKNVFRNIFRFENDLLTMLTHGRSCMPGMLVDSRQICGLWHLPTEQQIETYSLKKIEALGVPNELRDGFPHLGYQKRGEQNIDIYRPRNWQYHHILVCGDWGTGKTTLITHIVLQLAKAGYGILIVDPHLQMALKLAVLIKRATGRDIIWADFFDEDHTLCWNLFDVDPRNANRLLDKFFGIVKSQHSSRDLGSVQELLLKRVMQAVLLLRGLTIVDADILFSETQKGKSLRQRLLSVLTDRWEQRFWKKDYRNISSAERQRVLEKLPFLIDHNLRRCFSQPDNRVNLGNIMKNGEIIMVPLNPGVSSETTRTIACMSVSLAVAESLARLAEKSPKPFAIVMDELGYFQSRDLQHLLRQVRKSKIEVVTGLQSINELEHEVNRQALQSFRTTVAFDVNYDDAKQLSKRFSGLLKPTDFMMKGVGIGHAVVGTHYTSLTTPAPPPLDNVEDEIAAIKQASFAKYYVPATQQPTTLNTTPQSSNKSMGIPLIYDK